MHTNAHQSDIKPRMHDNQHDAQLSHGLGSFSPDSCRLVSIGGFQQVRFLDVMRFGFVWFGALPLCPSVSSVVEPTPSVEVTPFGCGCAALGPLCPLW